MNNFLSIVVPCYNEYKSLPELFRKAQYITKNYPIEIILVNNGSTDDSNKYFSSFNSSERLKLVEIEINQGYGYCIKYGFQFCTGSYIGWTHGDLQTDLFDLIRAYNSLNIAVNSSSTYKPIFLKGRRYARPLIDSLISSSMGLFTNILFLSNKYNEINAQPSIYPISMKDILVINAPNDYFLDIYAYLVALNLGYEYLKIPVFFNSRQYGQSHWNKNKFAKLKFIYNNIKFIIITWYKLIK
tara:strand:- start:117 stop:842 length:726 start_codon:yes stop_codon:yes gene_type:complete